MTDIGLKEMVDYLESKGRDPTGFKFYGIGKSKKTIDIDGIWVETSPESEMFEKYTYHQVKKIYDKEILDK